MGVGGRGKCNAASDYNASFASYGLSVSGVFYV